MKHSKKSHEYKVLKYMQQGGKLTPKKATRLFAVGRLASRINRLKDEGHDEISVRDYRVNRSTTVAQYYIDIHEAYLESL